MDCFCQREVNSEWKGERKINRPLLYFAKKKKEKASEKVFFSSPGLLVSCTDGVSTGCGGQTNSKVCFFYIQTKQMEVGFSC